MHWYCSRIQGKENGCCRVQTTHRALLQNRVSTKSLEILQTLQIHGISNSTWDATRKALSHQQSSPQYSPLSHPTVQLLSPLSLPHAFRADPTVYFQAHEIPSPKSPGMPRNTRLPQATHQSIFTSQPRAVPKFMAQRPHRTAQGTPRKHRAPATHRNSTSDPTVPTPPAGTYLLDKVPLSRFPTRWVRSPQAEALSRHPGPTARCLGSATVPHGTVLEDTWQHIPESPAP